MKDETSDDPDSEDRPRLAVRFAVGIAAVRRLRADLWRMVSHPVAARTVSKLPSLAKSDARREARPLPLSQMPRYHDQPAPIRTQFAPMGAAVRTPSLQSLAIELDLNAARRGPKGRAATYEDFSETELLFYSKLLERFVAETSS